MGIGLGVFVNENLFNCKMVSNLTRESLKMTNAFTRGLRRLFGKEKKPQKPSNIDYKPANLEEVSLQVEDKALTVTSQKAASKKATIKKVVKKKAVKKKAVPKRTAKKIVKKTISKK